MILGIGVDLVDIVSFRDIINDPASAFKKRHFTPSEIAYCEGQKGHDPVHHYAGRYAAKEAYIKARGQAFKNKKADIDINYCEIEVSTDSDSGPEIGVSGKLKERMEASGVKKIFVSISHEANTTVAMVILEG